MTSTRQRAFEISPDKLALIKQKMAEKRLNDTSLAKKSGLNLSTIQRNLFKRRWVQESTIEAVAETLGIKPTDIIDPTQWNRQLKTSQSQSSDNPTLRQICEGLIKQHGEWLTTNSVMLSGGVRFRLDDIFVPLSVVERSEKPQYTPDNHTFPLSTQNNGDKVKPISYDDFFTKVLKEKQSAKSQGSRIAIIGEAGAGKTTQLQKIGEWILEETDDIPIWISSTEIEKKPIKEYLFDDWLRNATQELETAPPHYRDELRNLLKSGKVWLLLDGVDEMSVPDPLYQIASQINKGLLHNIRVVLTCRLNVWDAGKNSLDGFDVYKNLDFVYPTEVHQFISKWFKNDYEQGENLKSELEKSNKEVIQDFVKNPLSLTLLCYSWQLQHEERELPEIKAELYEWFVNTFYEWNKNKVQVNLDRIKRQNLNDFLGELAKTALDQEISRFRLSQKFINQFLGEDKQKKLLFDLAVELNWLITIGVAKENPLEVVYAFFHPTFQEYFAALSIKDWDLFLPSNHIDKPFKDSQGHYKRYRAFEPQWREVILLWAGSNHIKDQQKEEFAWSLIKFQDGCNNIFNKYDHSRLLEDFLLIFKNTSLNDITYEYLYPEAHSYHYNLRFWAEWFKHQKSPANYYIYNYDIVLINIKRGFETNETTIADELIYYLNIWMHFEYIKDFVRNRSISQYKHLIASTKFYRRSEFLIKNKSEVDKLNISFNNEINTIFCSSNISELLKLINPHNHPFIKGASIARLEILICYDLVNNQETVEILLKHLKLASNTYQKCTLVYLLSNFAVNHLQIVQQLSDLLQISQEEIILKAIIHSLYVINKQLPKDTVSKIKAKKLIVSAIGRYINQQNNKELSITSKLAYDLAARCSEYLKYEEFWEAWHSQTSIPTFKAQLTDLAKQLKPTESVYPLVINSLNLATETNEEAIANFLSTKIYKHPQVNIPGKPPTVRNAAELQQHLFTIQEHRTYAVTLYIAY